LGGFRGRWVGVEAVASAVLMCRNCNCRCALQVGVELGFCMSALVSVPTVADTQICTRWGPREPGRQHSQRRASGGLRRPLASSGTPLSWDFAQIDIFQTFIP
jgi:hypothetical protein